MEEKNKPNNPQKAKVEEKKEITGEVKTQVKQEEKKTEAVQEKEETKEKKLEVKKVKKTEAVVKVGNLPMSTKYSMDICRFIKGKEIDKAITLLDRVTQKRMAIPMRGEIPHRKGNIMAGRYPIKASKIFIDLLKSLAANASVNGLDEPVIIHEASASFGSRPMRRGGRRFKRTYVYIIAREKNAENKLNKEKQKK